MFRIVVLVAIATISSGCAAKWIPDTESALNPPVAYQQQFIAEALDDAFSTMDFSRLADKLVAIEVLGVYVDGDIADYIRGKVQVELAKAGAMSEPAWATQDPDFKMNIMIRHGGVNDLVKAALFYEWRIKEFTYDIEVAAFSLDGGSYFSQSGQGTQSVTVARRLYAIFFPIPLPNDWTTTKGRTPYIGLNETYSAGKQVRNNPSLMGDRGQLPSTLNIQ